MGFIESGGPCPNLMILAFLDNPTQAPASDCLASLGAARGVVHDPPPVTDRLGALMIGISRFDTQFVIRAAAVRGPVQALVGLLSLLGLGLALRGGLSLRRHRAAGLRLSLTWAHSLRLIGWGPLVISAGLVGLVCYAAQSRFLPLKPAEAIALVLPLVAALQAAFLCSPEDEPALEVMLATPRPPAWTLFERLSLLFAMQGGLGLAAALLTAPLTGEPGAAAIGRWLPLIFFLSGVAVYLTLTTRRALFGVLGACLLWITTAFFGEFLVERWPAAWPLHLYLQPDQADYPMNRLFIAGLGLTLLGLAAAYRLNDPERLLLGYRFVGQSIGGEAGRSIAYLHRKGSFDLPPEGPPSPPEGGVVGKIPPSGGLGGPHAAIMRMAGLPLQRLKDSTGLKTRAERAKPIGARDSAKSGRCFPQGGLRTNVLGSLSATALASRSIAPYYRFIFLISISRHSLVLTQLAAMIRYEFVLQWRRAALPAVVVGLMVTPVLGAVMARPDFQGYPAALANGLLAPEVARTQITAAMLPVMWLGAALMTLLLIPLVAADVIPRDQQVGMRELLAALPLSPATYLAGKLFSLWLSLLAALGLAGLLSGATWRWLIGPFEAGPYLELWFVGATLLALINGGLSMLLAAGQPTNSRAMLAGGVYVLLCLAGLGFAFSTEPGWQHWLNPGRP